MKVEIINRPMLCWDNEESGAEEYHVLAKVVEADSKYQFKVLHDNGNVVGFKNAKEISKPKPRTIEDGLVEGDVIVNDNYIRTILGVCGKVYLASSHNNPDYFHFGYTLVELIQHNYKLFVEPQVESALTSQVTEMTVAEISKALGKTVKVVE